VANLSKTYVDAIPFFPLTVASSLVFSALFFGIDVGLKKLLNRNEVSTNKGEGLLKVETEGI
jgi:hypothetical protein